MKRGGGGVGVFHMVHFEHPPKNIKTVTETIAFYVQPDGTLCVDETHRTAKPDAFKLCTLDFDPGKGEKALLLELRCAHVHNEFEEAFFWDVEGLFDIDPSPALRAGEGSIHPDSTGKTCVVIPGGGYKGIIPETNRVVYKPRLKHLDVNLLPYVGLETQILNANSTCISDAGTLHEYCVFNVTDPFLVFLMQHKHRFDEVNASDIRTAKTDVTHTTYYLVKRPLVKRVQSFFKTLYSLILYMRQPVIEFKWRVPPKGGVLSPPPPKAEGEREGGRFITAIIQADYLVLTPEVLTYKAHGEKLNL